MSLNTLLEGWPTVQAAVGRCYCLGRYLTGKQSTTNELIEKLRASRCLRGNCKRLSTERGKNIDTVGGSKPLVLKADPQNRGPWK